MDGLVSNASLILGVGGGGGEPRVILLAGLAGMVAGSMSMAAGEYISVRSQNELTHAETAVERDKLGCVHRRSDYRKFRWRASSRSG